MEEAARELPREVSRPCRLGCGRVDCGMDWAWDGFGDIRCVSVRVAETPAFAQISPLNQGRVGSLGSWVVVSRESCTLNRISALNSTSWTLFADVVMHAPEPSYPIGTVPLKNFNRDSIFFRFGTMTRAATRSPRKRIYSAWLSRLKLAK